MGEVYSVQLNSQTASGTSVPPPATRPATVAQNTRPAPAAATPDVKAERSRWETILFWREEKKAPVDHWQLLERNYRFRREQLRKQLDDTLRIVEDAVGLVGQKEGTQSLAAKARQFLFDTSRKANFQADNWLMLEAANKCLYLHDLSRGEPVYLDKAKVFLTRALGNADGNLSFDIYRFSRAALLSPTIHPVEAYFELKLTLFQVLSYTDPKAAIRLADEIERELADTRLLQAQRQNPVAAEGYRNRLALLRGFAGIYNPEIKPAQAFTFANTAQKWAHKNYQSSALYRTVWGMTKKDLRYDVLNAQIIKGRLLVKMRQYDAAVSHYRLELEQPEAIRRVDGFLDIGLKAVYGLLQIALATSSSRAAAADKLAAYLDWEKLASAKYVDLRVALGLAIADRSWLGETFNIDTEPEVISQLDLKRYPSSRDKLGLLMRLAYYADIPYDLKAEIISLYDLLPEQEKH